MTFIATDAGGRAARIARRVDVLAALVAVSMAVCFFLSGPAQGSDGLSGKAIPAVAHPALPAASPYHPVSVPNRARTYYLSVWGVDNLMVRQTASGNLIRFSYRVTDPALARMLGDKLATPYMFGQRSHALLQIPVMDKVGQLRQTGELEAGKEYWMVFSNKGNFIKAGDRVNVIVGSVHVDGLLVQ